MKTLREKIANWAIRFLQQGLTPERLAMCIALAIVIGMFPVIGSTTLLCALAAGIGRLNQVAMQSVNYAVSPLQLLVLIPLYRLGSKLFHVPPEASSARQVLALIHESPLKAIDSLWITTMHAIVVWIILAPFAIGLAYWIIVTLLRRLHDRGVVSRV